MGFITIRYRMTATGTIEMDASIMEGTTRRAGAVAAGLGRHFVCIDESAAAVAVMRMRLGLEPVAAGDL